MSAAKIPVDQDVRDLIASGGLGDTMFVGAGAGTGKTKSLVDRIVNLVSTTDVRLESVAAITFTEAAAAELRDRIRTELDTRLGDPDSVRDDTVRSRLQTALDDTDVAAISTLHAFCLRILNEHPIDIGLPPRVEILDEVTSLLEAEERWERFLDELFADPAMKPVLVRAHSLGVRIEASKGAASLHDVAGIFDDNWDRLGGVPDVPIDGAGLDLTGFIAAIETFESHLAECIDRTDKLFVNTAEHPLTMRAVAAEPDVERQLQLLNSREWKPGQGGKQGNWNCDTKEVREALKAVNEAAASVVAAEADRVLGVLAHQLAQFVEASANERRRAGRLEYHDLLVLARQLLRTSADARHALHDRYVRLLLDEFQDTDPIQIEVATLIASGIGRGPLPKDWQDAQVVAGRVFCVGDPKQSIYRFRRADVALFGQARTALVGDAGVELAQNFRTVPSIVEWVNSLFDQLMPSDGDPAKQPAYVPLTAFRDAHSVQPAVVVVGGPSQDKAGEIREAEANDVAAVIGDIARNPADWQVFDDRTEAWVDPKLSDITVLLPTRTSLRALERALEDEGVAYRVDTGTLVYGTQEVRDLLAAIRVIDDPTDELALVTALRSPLYACSDRDLLTYRHARGRWSVRSTMPDALPTDHPVVAAIAHLRSLWEQRSWTEPSALIGRLLSDRRAFVLAHSHRRPREVWRRYRFLVDQARLFAESGGGDLRRFVQWAALQSSEGSRVHEPLLPETDDDAVRILTIHGSKGLEFPITVLSGMSTGLGKARGGVTVHWDDDDRPAVKLKKGITTENFDRLAELELEMSLEESKRLLYVACTRARDHLVVSTHHKVLASGKAPDSHGAWMHTLAPGPDSGAARGFTPTETERTAVQTELVSPPSDDREAFAASRTSLLSGTGESTVLSATAIARLRDTADPDTDRVGDAGESAAEKAASDEQTTWRKGRAGSSIGRAVHASLELLDIAETDEQIPVLATQQAHLEAIDEHAATVEAMIWSAVRSPIVAEGLAGRHWRELYVAAPVGDGVIEGYVDLLVERPEGLVVVDYKTDTVRSEAEVDEKLAHYELQAASYAVAIEASTGRPVVGAGFVFCRPQGAIERMIDDLDAAKAEVRSRLGA